MRPLTLPADLLTSFPRSGGRSPRGFSLPADSPEFKNYHWDHEVLRSGIGPQGYVHPQAIYHWLEESLFVASSQAGWPMKRMHAAGFLTIQIRHNTAFESYLALGETVRVQSRLIEVKRLRGTWLQEMFRLKDGKLLVRDFSTGVFLNLEGRPATPLNKMITDLQFG